MQRQVCVWDKDYLPDKQELQKLQHMDGILLTAEYNELAIMEWLFHTMDKMYDLPAISFTYPEIQKLWWTLTSKEFIEDLLT